MPAYFDNFTRADGALGSPWSTVRGTVSIQSNRAYGNPNDNAIAVVDAGTNGGDVQLSATCAYANTYEGGQALYFRVVDANNWWRFYVYRYYIFYGTGGYTCQNRLNNGAVGPVEQSPVDSSGPYTDAQGNPGYRYCDVNGYYTYYFDVVLEKSVNGTLSSARAQDVAQPLSLRVTALGNTISGYINGGTTPLVTTTDATFATATRHGLGYATSSYTSSNLGMGSFAMTPLNQAPNGGARNSAGTGSKAIYGNRSRAIIL